MRYLNRIIFINSAHVPYAEVNLDGNVHFIGTQGVGKSTILRSILFFYNADKGRLGIRTQDKQQSYDDFYLPYANSYIIYEVARENGKFFVITFRSQGRTAFRIVDCEYCRNYFIDDFGMARDEWGKISEIIGGKIFKSRIVRSYEEFRDIIYGNRQNVDQNLRRFCIMESDRYQNIVRAITNIFLNQSLESRVIKETIIDSLDFSNDSVNLSSERDRINEFRTRYGDIWKWYKREKNGSVKVRLEAQRVIDEYLGYESLCHEIDEFCNWLVYALDRDIRMLPTMEEKISLLSDEASRQQRLLSEESEKYSAERDRFMQSEGELKGFLKRLEEKSRHYEQIGIADIVSRVEREGELKIRQSSLEKQLDILTSKNQDVKTKYERLYQDIEIGLKESINEIEHRLHDAIQQCNEEKTRLIDNSNASLDNIRCCREDARKEIAEELQIAESELNNLRISQEQMRNTNPYDKEMSELASFISDLKTKEKDLEKCVYKIEGQIDRLRHEAEIIEKDLTVECEKDIANIEKKITSLDTELSRINSLLKSYSGSLMEWLCENKPGWEDNLGLFLDEQNVLYNTNLNPCMVDMSQSIYGLRIDIANIEREVHSPQDLQNQAKGIEGRKNILLKEIANRRQRLQSEIADALAKPRKQLKAMMDEQLAVKSQLSIMPDRIVRAERELSDWQEKLQSWRNKRQDEILHNRAEAEKRKKAIEARKQQMERQFSKEEKDSKDKFKKQKNGIDEKIKDLKSAAENEKAQKRQESAAAKKEVVARMDAELKGAGVDPGQIEDLRRKLDRIKDELNYIKQHSWEYFGWINDKKEYFDLEDEKRTALKEVRKKIEELKAKYDLRKHRIEQKRDRVVTELKKLTDARKSLEKTIDKVRVFMNSEARPVNLGSAKPVETVRGLAEIFDDLRDRLLKYQKHEEDFRKAVNDFKSNFSSTNTLGFKCDISTIAEYRKFASDLDSFMSNNMIEIVRTRTNEMYASIIQRIGREVSDLLLHAADIRKTINEINKDFRENNFAGVIKEIELRAVESNDRIMQQLLLIKEFDDDNSRNLGEINLFTDIDNRDKANERAASMLMTLGELMDAESKREKVTLADTFKLEFKVRQNDQDTNWVEKLTNVGSDGTDILVKAIVNIMLINVFKRKASARFGDFTLHCMMDEIGKLHPNNVQGILLFANARNIRLINSSPTTYNASAYRYTYMLCKDEHSNTMVKSLLSIR